MSRTRFPRRPAQRAVRNQLAVMQAMHDNTTPVIEQGGVKRGKQPEGLVNKAIAAWRKLRPSVFLERNKRRLATPVGYDKPIMLGYQAPGSSDWLGWESVVVTPAMCGRRIAVAMAVEAKTKTGRLGEEQEAFLNRLSDDGGIAGVATSAEDCELIRARWLARMTADER